MRIANLAGRLVVITGPADAGEARAVDVAEASGGRFGPDPMSAFADWEAFHAWAADLDAAGEPFRLEELGPPVPRPGQIVAIGINYRAHGDEQGYPPDQMPVVFTKFASALTGPSAEVALPEGNVDWEVELVVVVGEGGRDIPRDEAWARVAGLTIGQDLSERIAQKAGSAPQYSLAKSHAGFAPTGPWVVTPDELPEPGDLAIGCALDGESMQSSRTSRMIYDVPELIARLSAVIALRPGDLIFTGTPSGVGSGREPQRFLRPGETLVSTIEGIGSIETRFVAR